LPAPPNGHNIKRGAYSPLRPTEKGAEQMEEEEDLAIAQIGKELDRLAAVEEDIKKTSRNSRSPTRIKSLQKELNGLLTRIVSLQERLIDLG